MKNLILYFGFLMFFHLCFSGWVNSVTKTNQIRGSTNLPNSAISEHDYTSQSQNPKTGTNVRRPKLGTEEEKLPGEPYYIVRVDVSGGVPFYKGPWPLVFEEGVRPGGITLYHKFDGWRNAFIYNDTLRYRSLAGGARTTDKAGRVIAEAKLSRIFRDEFAVEIEEFHYTPQGDIQFYCKSKISRLKGIKISEAAVNGKKIKDYYFIWPVRSQD